MNRRIRGHANFVEYVPLCLLLIAILEFSHFSIYLIHALGLALLIGRILHGYAFSFTESSKFGRMWGTDGVISFDDNNSFGTARSEEHTSELQSLMRISYAVFCLKKKIRQSKTNNTDSNDTNHV